MEEENEEKKKGSGKVTARRKPEDLEEFRANEKNTNTGWGVGVGQDVRASWKRRKQGLGEPTEIQGQKVLEIAGNRKCIGDQVVFPFVSNSMLLQAEL